MPAHGVGVLPSRWSLRNDPAGTATGAEDGAPAPAPKHPQSRKNYAASAHAQPPLCVGQPLPALVQHHAFFATLQPATQLAKPASQSNGAEVVPAVTQPVAAPLLLRNAPACLPVFESSGAIVWVSWRRRLGRIAVTDVVIGAAPRLLVGSPHHPQVHCAIEGVDWSRCRSH